MGSRHLKGQRSLFLMMDQSFGIPPVSEEPTGGATRETAVCLLCRGADSRCISRLSCADLLKAWAQLGVRFSEQAWAVLCERNEVELLECQECGFRFFDGTLAGEGTFYAELQKQIAAYYAGVRP